MSEWIDVKEKHPNVQNGIFRVRKQNGNEVKAFYHDDHMAKFSFYGVRPCAWWDYETSQPLGDVTHWLEKEKS